MSAPVLAGHPLLGAVPALRRDPLGTFQRVLDECGDIGRLLLGPPGARMTLYVVAHPEGVRRVLGGRSGNYGKHGVVGYAEIRALAGDGLLTSDGETWKQQRRSLQPLFTPRHVSAYAGLMVEEAVDLVARWRAASAGGRPVDLHREMLGYALRVIGRSLFGRGVDVALPIMAEALPACGAYISARANAPVRLPRSWPLPSNRRAQQARAALYGIVDELVAARRAAETPGEDLLGHLLAARDPETGEGLDDAQVRDQVLIFLLAGHETTATALTFTLHLLGRHPEVQRQVAAEALAVLGEREATAADLGALPFTGMVVKEAMRLYPPAHLLARAALADDELCGHPIPAGAQLLVLPWITHRHPAFWEQPERFDPLRFTPEREKGRDRYAYIPLGGGPRACIGTSFAQLETVLATATIVRDLQLRTPPGPLPLIADITMRPAGPVPAWMTPRASAAQAGLASAAS